FRQGTRLGDREIEPSGGGWRRAPSETREPAWRSPGGMCRASGAGLRAAAAQKKPGRLPAGFLRPVDWRPGDGGGGPAGQLRAERVDTGSQVVDLDHVDLVR